MIYSINHVADEDVFADHNETTHKNAENETANLFSILFKLEGMRTCEGLFHFKLCYQELEEDYPFPCNEWRQKSNPLYESVVHGFEPLNITFNSAKADFNGLALSKKGIDSCLMEDHPYNTNNRSFCIGHRTASDGQLVGPPKHAVKKVELFIFPGRLMYF